MRGLVLTFLLLSAADLFLTWWLIARGGAEVLESNPLAAYWLGRFGWGGLSVFKLGLFLLIGGLALGVARARQRTGELLLIFACGAQSAVVLTSLFMANMVRDAAHVAVGNDGKEIDFYSSLECLPENGLALLSQPLVQEELGLTEPQLLGIVELVELRADMRVGIGHVSLAEWNNRFAALLGQEKSFIDSLGPQKIKRLLQISWQERGPLAFDDPYLSETLAFTEQQAATFNGLLDTARKARDARLRDARTRQDGGVPADDEHIKRHMLAQLSHSQREKWHTLLGEPFATPAQADLSLQMATD